MPGCFFGELSGCFLSIEEGCCFFECTLVSCRGVYESDGFDGERGSRTYVLCLDEVEVDEEGFEGEPNDIYELNT